MVDFQALMKFLSEERPIFHSEADFQHSIAWTLHTHYPNADVRLEYPFSLGEGQGHIDLLATIGKQRHAIELKYKTSAFKGEVRGEEFRLRNHAAQDISRYDILKDLSRVERVAAEWKDTFGWVVFLTNDSPYWSKTGKGEAVDAAFRIHEGAALSGALDWKENTSDGTTRNRTTPIRLLGRYRCEWRDYSKAEEGRNSRFRYLLLRADGAGCRHQGSPSRPTIPASRSHHEGFRTK
jgi:hypothetical protein